MPALVHFNQTSPRAAGLGGGIDRAYLVDAVTGATLRMHASHSVRWDLTDKDGMTVPDGDYRVVVEATDNLQSSSVTWVAFVKSGQPLALVVYESEDFGPINLVYVPAAPR